MGHKITNPSCIYAIQCQVTGRLYIGRTYRLRGRIAEHFSQLRRGEKGLQGSKRYGDNAKLFQQDYDKYGEESFSVFVLEENVPPEQCKEAEHKWILEYKSYDPRYGYNIRDEHLQEPFPVAATGIPKKPWEIK